MEYGYSNTSATGLKEVCDPQKIRNLGDQKALDYIHECLVSLSHRYSEVFGRLETVMQRLEGNYPTCDDCSGNSPRVPNGILEQIIDDIRELEGWALSLEEVAGKAERL